MDSDRSILMKWLENKSMVNFVEYVTLDVEWHLTAPIS